MARHGSLGARRDGGRVRVSVRRQAALRLSHLVWVWAWAWGLRLGLGFGFGFGVGVWVLGLGLGLSIGFGFGFGCRSVAAESYRAAAVRAERLVVHLVRVKAGVRLGLGPGLGLGPESGSGLASYRTPCRRDGVPGDTTPPRRCGRHARAVAAAARRVSPSACEGRGGPCAAPRS